MQSQSRGNYTHGELVVACTFFAFIPLSELLLGHEPHLKQYALAAFFVFAALFGVWFIFKAVGLRRASRRWRAAGYLAAGAIVTPLSFTAAAYFVAPSFWAQLFFGG